MADRQADGWYETRKQSVVFIDREGGGYRALRLTGMPELIGVREGQMMWSVAGVLNDAATVESVVRTWVTY